MYHKILGESTLVRAIHSDYDSWIYGKSLITLSHKDDMIRVSSLAHPAVFHTCETFEEAIKIADRRFNI